MARIFALYFAILKEFPFVAGQGQADAVPAEGGGEEEEEVEQVGRHTSEGERRVPHRH